MSTEQSWQDGILRVQVTNATRATDPTPAGYTDWNADGTVKTQRALTAAETTRLAAEDVSLTTVANQATIQANIQTHIGQLEAWMTANPNGAVMTAAQTKFLAQTLVGVGRLLLGLTSTIGGAT